MDDVELHKRLNAALQQIGLLERKVEFLYRHLGATFVDTRPPPSDIERLIIGGDLVGAINLYRKNHGASLTDAKRAVDEMKAKLGL
jgi:hypothetical protein